MPPCSTKSARQHKRCIARQQCRGIRWQPAPLRSEFSYPMASPNAAANSEEGLTSHYVVFSRQVCSASGLRIPRLNNAKLTVIEKRRVPALFYIVALRHWFYRQRHQDLGRDEHLGFLSTNLGSIRSMCIGIWMHIRCIQRLRIKYFCWRKGFLFSSSQNGRVSSFLRYFANPCVNVVQ